jgi:hypothetical protein
MERKSLKPLLQWLKVSLFDYVLQDLLGQDDMEWQWPALDVESDEEKKSTVWKTLTSFGAMSVDEVRIELGKAPWGLPQTSDPLVFTPTGAIPLGNVPPPLAEEDWDEAPIVAGPEGPQMDPEAQSQQQVAHQEAMNQVKPPPPPPGTGPPGAPTQGPPGAARGQQKPPVGAGAGASRGGPPTRPTAAPANIGSTGVATGRGARKPARKALTNAMLAELESMRRYLKKGNDPEAWKADVLPPEVVAKVRDELDG